MGPPPGLWKESSAAEGNAPPCASAVPSRATSNGCHALWGVCARIRLATNSCGRSGVSCRAAGGSSKVADGIERPRVGHMMVGRARGHGGGASFRHAVLVYCCAVSRWTGRRRVWRLQRTRPLLDVPDADGHPPPYDVLAQLRHALAPQLVVDAVPHARLLVGRHVCPVPLGVLARQASSLLFGKSLVMSAVVSARFKKHVGAQPDGDRDGGGGGRRLVRDPPRGRALCGFREGRHT